MHASRLAAVTLGALVASSAAHAPASARQEPPGPAAAKAEAEVAAAREKPRETVAELLRLVGGERRKDADAWYRLGLAHAGAGDAASAREAFRQALKLRSGHFAARASLAYVLFIEGNFDESEGEARRVHAKATLGNVKPEERAAADAVSSLDTHRFRRRCLEALPRLEQALSADPDDAQLHLTKGQALVGLTLPEPRLSFLVSEAPPPDEEVQKAAREKNRKLYAAAAESFESYLRLAPKARDAEHVRGQLEALRFYAREGEAGGEAVYTSSKVTAKAVMGRKPEPGFTQQARDAGVSGVIRIRVVLAADGEVKHVLVIKPLSHGLAENVVRAARSIKFKPAVLDGRPVSQHATLEYAFHVF
ncbi:MAG TPA: TonB family protein [Pyrinomonadaceae bacterium]|nr:TonB family protein [Pyrinomonadaceae bacterium]